MGNFSRKAALGVASLLTAATVATVIGGTASATPAATATPSARVVPATAAAPAAPTVAGASTREKRPTHPVLYWPAVKRGDYGQRVVAIQCLLVQRGFGKHIPCAKHSGSFGRETEKAIQAFQWVHKIYPDGTVGRRTWEKLVFTLWKGSPYFYAVLALQSNLAWNYHYQVNVDGVFGNQTKWAVIDFQKKYHIYPADGVVGRKTWHELIVRDWR
jgi:peptidoglycan hydrolase-like protein with peptidoglycan-binding domain